MGKEEGRAQSTGCTLFSCNRKTLEMFTSSCNKTKKASRHLLYIGVSVSLERRLNYLPL